MLSRFSVELILGSFSIEESFVYFAKTLFLTFY